MSHRIRSAIVLALLVSADLTLAQSEGGKPVTGKPRRAIAAKLTETPSVSVSFVTGPAIQKMGDNRASLDLGQVSYARGASRRGVSVERRKGALLVSTEISVKLDSGGAGNAALSAFLTSPDPVRTIYLDGVRLTTTSQVVKPSVPYNTIVEHKLSIEVPMDTSETQNNMSLGIGFVVTPN